LGTSRNPRCPKPGYDRSRVATGVVHFGVGGFHRAHQAMYHDRLLRAGASEWGICGVGVLESDRRMAEVMRAQRGLYTLVEKPSSGEPRARTIGALTEYLFAPDDPQAVIEKVAAPSTRIVSLTITEGGYGLDDHAVLEDLRSPDTPATAFGLLVEALRRRRERGAGPLTVVSCDNLPGNGVVARGAVTGFAGELDRSLAGWIGDEVRFPSSMVDRITPATTDADRRMVWERFGVDDAWPVVCEPYVQWVLEDDFAAGRPPYEDAGVQIVADVEPYELMKLRLLNASHQALAYFGRLCGYEMVHDAARDPVFQRFVLGYMEDEAAPTLPPVPGIDLQRYERELIERFGNPHVRDTIARLCVDSSDRIPKWLLPVIRSRLASGGEVARSAAIVASWARYAEGVDEDGAPIDVVDRLRDRVMANARKGPDAFIADRALFGDLGEDPRFAETFHGALRSLHERGARATLAALAGPA
jgi:mannitol 2-dehydrogenase